MQRYILSRIVQGAITLILASIFVFGLIRLSGDPTDLFMPIDATAEDRALMQKHLGLDKPVPVQYLIFISNAVRGDLGTSILRGTPVAPVVLRRLLNTLQLVLLALAFSTVVGITIGVISAVKPGSPAATFGRYFAMLGQSAPPFWVAIVLILLIGGLWRLLPTFGKGGIDSFILPVFTLGWYSAAAMMRISRTTMLDVLDSEYIKLARIKGLPESLVILKHAFKNTLITVLTMSSVQLIRLFNSAIIVEVIFVWPGLGSLIVGGIFERDYPIVQAGALTISALVITMNLLVDILYCYIDPRIRY